MFVTVFRTLLVRVRPNVLLIFKTYAEDGTNGDTPSRAGTPHRSRAITRPCKRGWKGGWKGVGRWRIALQPPIQGLLFCC